MAIPNETSFGCKWPVYSLFYFRMKRFPCMYTLKAELTSFRSFCAWSLPLWHLREAHKQTDKLQCYYTNMSVSAMVLFFFFFFFLGGGTNSATRKLAALKLAAFSHTHKWTHAIALFFIQSHTFFKVLCLVSRCLIIYSAPPALHWTTWSCVVFFPSVHRGRV